MIYEFGGRKRFTLGKLNVFVINKGFSNQAILRSVSSRQDIAWLKEAVFTKFTHRTMMRGVSFSDLLFFIKLFN